MRSRIILLLAMIYICLNILPTIMANKFILLPIGFISARALLGSVWYSLTDIIAEVYGMKASVYLFICSSICQIVFSLICSEIINLSSPIFWHEQVGYDLLFGNIVITIIIKTLVVVFAWYVNLYFLTRWKILANGKYFWLRTIGSSVIGITIFMIFQATIFYFAGLTSGYGEENVITFSFFAWLIKVGYIVILASPSALIVLLLKVVENVHADDQGHDKKFTFINGGFGTDVQRK